MIFNRIRLTTIVAILACCGSSVFAQILPPPDDSLIDNLLPPILPPILQPPSAQPLILERPLIIAPPTLPNQVIAPLAPERPLATEGPLLTQTVKDLVKDFQTVRQEFLQGQDELLRQLKNATDQERTIIREQLRERLNEWREVQKRHLRELREQARELATSLPALGDVINAGGGEPKHGGR